MAVAPPDTLQAGTVMLYIQELLAHAFIGLEAYLMGKNSLKRL